MITFSQLGKYGRFGNQLFQIASTIGIAMDSAHTFGFPAWEYQQYFKNPLPVINPGIVSRYEEESSAYEKLDFSGVDVDIDLHGYFQSYKYFDQYQEVIRHYFEPLEDKGFYTSCAIHVRRGDYLKLSHIHINLTMDYYLRAMKFFPEKTHFLVFSDDIDWCVKNFPSDRNITFGHAEDPISDFLNMSACQHFIVANSSFSWWAAWLGKSKDKIVVAPGTWVYNEPKETIYDRLPEDWIRVEI